MRCIYHRIIIISVIVTIGLSGNIFASDDSVIEPFSYTLTSQDTIASLSARYMLSEDVIRYYNNIAPQVDIHSGSVMTISRTKLTRLLIKPLWGSVIESQKDKTLTTIAQDYHRDVRELLLFNPFGKDDVIAEGTEVFLPYYDVRTTEEATISRISKNGGTQVDLSALSRKTAEEAMGKFMTFVYDDIDTDMGTLLSTRYQKGLGAGGFAAGQCTDYAASRRPDLFPNRAERLFGGNAKDRYANAKKAGVPVGKIPKKGAIAVFAPGRGGNKIYGHVAIVEKVSDKGKIEITDMNFKGLNVVTRRIIDASLPAGYIYKVDR